MNEKIIKAGEEKAPEMREKPWQVPVKENTCSNELPEVTEIKVRSDIFDGIGMTNPYTGAAINTIEEFLAYRKAFDEDDAEESSAGFSDEGKGLSEAAPVTKEIITKGYIDEEGKYVIEKQLAILKDVGMEYTSLDDLAEAENYDEIYGKVQKGYSLSDAVLTCCIKELLAKATEQGAQRERNVLASKAHMGKTRKAGGNKVAVPQDILDEFRRFNPKATDDAIREFYFSELRTDRA